MGRRAQLIVICLCSCAMSLAFAEKRSITEKDLFQFKWIGAPQISPDGSRVAYVKVAVSEKKDGYDTSIWSVSTRDGAPPRRLTDGSHDSSPRWSPDGKWLAFLRTAEVSPGAGPGNRPPAPQIYLLPMSGGESWRVTDLPRGAGAAVWSPDSKKIAFGSTTSPEDLAKQHKGAAEDAAKKNDVRNTDSSNTDSSNKDSSSQDASNKNRRRESQPAGGGSPEHSGAEASEHESDVRVITRSVYRLNGGGYLDPHHPAHIWLLTAPQGSDEKVTPTQLTSGEFSEEGALWSRDGSELYFTADRVLDPSYELPHTEIDSIPATGGSPRKILTLNVGAQDLSLSPDGKRLAFCAMVNEPVRSYTQPDLWVVELTASAKPRNLTEDYDFDVCGGILGDQAAPRGGSSSGIFWTPNGRTLITRIAKEGTANLAQFDIASGKVTELTRGAQSIESYQASRDSSTFVALISTPTNIGDLFAIDRSGRAVQLTHLNEPLFSQLNLTPPEEIWYSSFDGKRIEAWIQKPPDFDPSKKYPLILNIHGGPHAAYGDVFFHEMQWMAAKGYVVFYPNPRGSTSYGQEFGNIIQYHYPGDDFRDLMLGVDEVLKRGYVDSKRMGVTGGSGGGLLTNWVIGQTDRFAAAVSQRDIASWSAWWYSADFTLFHPSWFKAAPFQDAEDFVKRSPITYVQNVKTPLMLILGESDYRTPPEAGGEEMFRALKFLKKPVVMIRFPGESHELSRSGQPWHRVERLQHIVGWFDKYLQGINKPEYDQAVPPPSTTTALSGELE